MVAKSKAKKTCLRCEKPKALSTYYSSTSPLFKDGKIPYCKICLKEMVDEDNLDSVVDTLRAIDKPYLKTVWEKALKSDNNTFGEYMRMICSLHQYRDLRFKHTNHSEQGLSIQNVDNESVVKESINELNTEYGQIKITTELRSKWGDYDNRHILEMEKLFQEMLLANSIETPQHRRQLYFYCKLSVLMDKALTEGDYAGYEKLSRQFTELQKSSGFRPIDRKSSDEAHGIRSFSQIFAEVESNGYIEPLNIDNEANQDIVDKSILYILNYTRKLLNAEQLKEPPSDTPKVEKKVESDGDL